MQELDGSLRRDLGSSDVARRRDGVQRLATMEPVPVSAAILLVDAAGDVDQEVCDWATEALERLGPPELNALAELRKRLESSHADCAYWAATLLGRLASDAAPAVEPLVDVLRHHAALAVRERAAWALGRVGAAAWEAIPYLQQAARGDLPRLARLAQSAVRAIEAA